MESNLKVEKLRDKDNWHQWRFVIRTLMEEDDDVLSVCEGMLVRPQQGATDYEKNLKRFLKADKTARKLIVTTVERKPLDLLLSCTTAKEMWDKLNVVYDLKSDENLSMLQKQFFEFKWTESESVSYNLSKLEQLSNKMKSLGGEIQSSMLLTRILSSLPKRFNHFHSAWDSVDDKKKTLENLTARLMAEELRLQEQEDTHETSTALLANFKVGNKGSKNDMYKQVKNGSDGRKQASTCYNCGKSGHLKRDCFRCYICKKKGHKSNNCFKNKANTQQQSSNNQEGNCSTSWQQRPVSKVALIGTKDIDRTDIWVIDSGATDHMSRRRDWFSSFEEFKEPVNIGMGNGSNMTAYGKGNIDFVMCRNNEQIIGTIFDVLYVPDVIYNLFSVRYAGRKGIDCSITNHGTRCFLKRNDEIIATGSEYGNLLKLDIRVLITKICNLTEQKNESINVESNNLQLWHERLCHQNVRHVRNFLKNINIDIKSPDNEFFCEGCAYGKQHRLPFHGKKDRATRVREIIYTDVCGPMEVESLGRKLYFVAFKDDFSSFREIHFIREKSEVFEKLKLFCAAIENQFKMNIKEIHSDGGKEYDNKLVTAFLNSKGIKYSMNAPYTPEQNGVAERENRIILEAARSMLYSNSNLPSFLWAEAMNTAVHVINRTGPTKQNNQTPYELWYGKTSSIDKFKIFGTECFAHIPKEKRKKLDKKSIKGYLVGYHEDCKGYRVYVPDLRDVIVSRDVIFKPEKVFSDFTNINSLNNNNDEVKRGRELVTPKNDDLPVNEPNEMLEKSQEPLKSPFDDLDKRQLRDRSQIKPTDFYGCPITFIAEKLPSDYNEAIMSKEKNEWQAAMQDEMNSLYENKTWVLVEKPKDKKVINSRWVFTKKLNPDISERYKARLVVKGYSQEKGIDYKETFSPVVRFDTVRFILSIAARNGLYLGQFDVKTAFLYGDLNEDIYMKQPEGFDDGSSQVCKLLKSLYGLKQAPRCWTEHFTNYIKGLGFYQSDGDPCFYTYIKGNETILLAIYVDDGLIAASSEHLIDKLLNDLSKQFKITSTKNVTSYLGLEICKLKNGSIFIYQGSYIKKILDKFNMTEANCVSTPIDCNYDDCITKNTECKAPYREVVGNLMFLQIVSRPDISFAVNVVSRVLDKPTENHWMLVKRILRYLKGTIDVGLLYCNNGNFEAYSDADFAGDKDTRKSTSGIICKYANAAIIWRSKKQQCVSLSTTESEFVSAALAATEIMWLKKLFNVCKIDIENYVLYVDNMSAIKLICNPEFHQRTKHIDVKYKYVRDSFQNKEIDVQYVKSEEQIADICTKALPRLRYVYLRSKLGLKSKNETINCISIA